MFRCFAVQGATRAFPFTQVPLENVSLNFAVKYETINYIILPLAFLFCIIVICFMYTINVFKCICLW